MKRIMFSMIFLLVLYNSAYSQHAIGVKWEPFVLVTETDSPSFVQAFNNDAEGNFGVQSFYLTYKYKVTPKLQISAKGGYLGVSDKDFEGFELGGFIQYYPAKRVYGLLGITYHFNEGKTVSSSGQNINVSDEAFPFLVAGFGTKFSDDSIFSLGINICFPLKTRFREITVNENFTGIGDETFNDKLTWMWKLTLGLEFTIL